MMDFQIKYSFERRKSESSKILEKYPNRVPIIVSHQPKEFNLDKFKYLVPADLTIGQFICLLRQHINLESSKSIFIFVSGNIPPSNASIRDIYYSHKNMDGFLYFQVKKENTFG